jgi:hypothetical protein
MGSYRARVGLFDDLVPLEQKGACFWNVLQCHRMVFEFEKVNYRGHPGVVTEMNFFLLMERVDPAVMAHNEEQIKKLESESKALSADNKRLNDKYSKVERDLTNLTSAVSILRGKIKP